MVANPDNIVVAPASVVAHAGSIVVTSHSILNNSDQVTIVKFWYSRNKTRFPQWPGNVSEWTLVYLCEFSNLSLCWVQIPALRLPGLTLLFLMLILP